MVVVVVVTAINPWPNMMDTGIGGLAPVADCLVALHDQSKRAMWARATVPTLGWCAHSTGPVEGGPATIPGTPTTGETTSSREAGTTRTVDQKTTHQGPF